MTIITLGTMDIFHYGHVLLLKKCRELAGPEGKVVVGLNTDEFIEKYKGKKPIMDYVQREYSIQLTGLVDKIVPNDQKNGSAKLTILEHDPHFIVIGSDWARKDYVGQLGLDWDWLDDKGVGICYVNYTKGISTTELKKRVNEN